jgi:(2Fe-2S) ferredoxin
MFVVIFFERQIWNPQCDRNSANEIVQELTLERVTVQYLVLHAQVPSTKHRKEGNG